MSPEPVIHVLLVEDSPTNALLTEKALSLSRFHVQSSERLGDALRLLLDKHFDVVLLDLGLPDSQGLDTLRSLRSEIPQIAVIVLTGKDDEKDERVRRLTTMILQSSGYIVVTAADGAEAIQLADSHGGPFDLLVTDVVMPEMSGPDLAKTLQLQCRAMKVLFTSGYTGDAIFSHEALPNDVAFMQKPYTPSSLAKKVRQLLDDG